MHRTPFQTVQERIRILKDTLKTVSPPPKIVFFLAARLPFSFLNRPYTAYAAQVLPPLRALNTQLTLALSQNLSPAVYRGIAYISPDLTPEAFPADHPLYAQYTQAFTAYRQLQANVQQRFFK